MHIRNASIDDLNKIAKTHIECFPDSFSTALGASLLKKFYLQYLKEYPELFLIAVDSGSIAGFCMGYLCDRGNCNRSFVKHNIFPLAFRYLLLLIKGNKKAWERIKPSKKSKGSDICVYEPEFQNIPPAECGDLLSICVLPKWRGAGMANELISDYQNALKAIGRGVCFLTVATKNSRGIHFYEKNGFVPYRALGDMSMTYVKRL